MRREYPVPVLRVETFPVLQELILTVSSAVISVPDWQWPNPHPRHGESEDHHPVHHGWGALSACGPHLLQPVGHAPIPDQRDPAPPPHPGCWAVRGLQPGLRREEGGLRRRGCLRRSERTLAAIHTRWCRRRGVTLFLRAYLIVKHLESEGLSLYMQSITVLLLWTKFLSLFVCLK